jgi:SnoaL-like protein
MFAIHGNRHARRPRWAGRLMAALVLLGGLLLAPPAAADPAGEARALYQRFAAAQNDGDLAAVEGVLLDSPRFLWVSDGMSIWGREATLERMALFQKAEIWHVEPDLATAVAVPIDDRSAFLHLPLTLAIGSRAHGIDRVKFLVSVLCVETREGWRIAALFTTGDNRQ